MAATLVNRWKYTETSNTPTTWTCSLAAAAALINTSQGPQSGNYLVLRYAKDGSGQASSITGGWSSLSQDSNSTVVTGGQAWKQSDGTETSVALTFAAGEHGEVVVEEWSGVTGTPTMTVTNGSSTNANPPSSGAITTGDYFVTAACSIDSTVSPSAAPSGYSGLYTQTSGDASSATLATAYLTSTGSVSSVDPDAFTNTTEQWVAMTLVIPLTTSSTPTPSVGALSLAGGVVALALSLFPSAGALAFSGGTPTVEVVSGPTSVSPGSLTLSGGNVGIAFGGPTTGSVAVSGGTPTLIVGSNTAITPSAGALAFTGNTASLVYAYTITPSAGALAFSGGTPSLGGAAAIIPTVASLSLSGGTLALSIGGANSIRTPDTAALSLTGGDPGIAFGGPTTGALTLAGGTVTVNLSTGSSFTLTPSAASLSLSGGYVEIDFFGPDTGTLTLSGGTPTVSVAGSGGTTLSPAAGSLTLSGGTPDLLTFWRLTPSVGTLTLAGGTVTLTVSAPAGPSPRVVVVRGESGERARLAADAGDRRPVPATLGDRAPLRAES